MVRACVSVCVCNPAEKQQTGIEGAFGVASAVSLTVGL